MGAGVSTKKGILHFLRGEVHLPNSGVFQQLLYILPEQLLPHLRLELNLHRLIILYPALRRNKRIIRAKQEPIL